LSWRKTGLKLLCWEKCCAGDVSISMQKQRRGLHAPLPIHLVNSLVNSISDAESCWYYGDGRRLSPADHWVAAPLAQYQAFTVNVYVKAMRKHSKPCHAFFFCFVLFKESTSKNMGRPRDFELENLKDQ